VNDLMQITQIFSFINYYNPIIYNNLQQKIYFIYFLVFLFFCAILLMSGKRQAGKISMFLLCLIITQTKATQPKGYYYENARRGKV